MKKKILLLISFLFIFIPFVVKAEDESKIEIKSLEYIDKSDKTEILEEASIEGINIKFNIKFYDEGDYARYKLVLKNNSNLELTVDEESLVSSNEYISYEFKYLDNSKVVGVGKEKEIELKIIYKKNAPSVLFRSSVYDASNTLEMALGDNLISIPNTLRNIGVVGVVSIIVINMLVILGIYLIYNNNKTGINSLIIIFILGIVLLPKLTKATEKYIVPINSKIIIQSVTPTLCTTEEELVQGLEYRISPNSQYVYRYKQEWTGSDWTNITEDGWGVKLDNPDSTDDVTEALCSTIKEKPITSMRSMFMNTKAKHIDLSSFVTNEVTDMDSMFQGATEVEELDFRTFNTEKLVTMQYILKNCTSLKELTLRQFVTSNVINYYAAFDGDSSIETLNLDGWDLTKAGVNSCVIKNNTSLKSISAKEWKIPSSFTFFTSSWACSSDLILDTIDATDWDLSSASSFNNSFYNSKSIKNIKGMDTWDTSTITDVAYMFDSCPKLESVDLSAFDFSKFTSYDQYKEILRNDKALKSVIMPEKVQTVGTLYLPTPLFTDDNVGYTEVISSDTDIQKTELKAKDYAMFANGQTFRNKVISLADNSNFEDKKIYHVKQSNTAPDDNNKTDNNIVSDANSPKTIYAWFDNGTLYYYADADILLLNRNASYMFNGLGYVESIELDNLNSSITYDMNYMFSGTGSAASNGIKLVIDKFNIHSLSYAYNMFSNFGYSAKNVDLTIKNFKNKRTVNEESMFYQVGYSSPGTVNLLVDGFTMNNSNNSEDMFTYTGGMAQHTNVTLKNWDLSNQKTTRNMFYNFAFSCKDTKLVIEDWDTSGVEDMSSMFTRAMYYNLNLDLDLTGLDVSNVKNMNAMFAVMGQTSRSSVKIDMTGWDTSKVENMSSMFLEVGRYAGETNEYDGKVELIGLDTWDVSNVKNFSNMFSYSGYYAKSWSAGDLSSWDVKSGTEFGSMFGRAGYRSETWDIGNLSNWDFKNARSLLGIFGSGYNSNTVYDMGTIDIYDHEYANSIFEEQKAIKVVLNIHNKLTRFTDMFKDAATIEGSSIVVNYAPEVDNIDDIIATKSSNSNVIKGNVIS